MPDARVARQRMQGALQTGQWFRSLAPELRQWLLEHAAARRLQAGERLFSRGDPPCGLYGVVQGSIRIAGVSVDGKEALFTLIVNNALNKQYVSVPDGGGESAYTLGTPYGSISQPRTYLLEVSANL